MRELTNKGREGIPGDVSLFTMFDHLNCNTAFTEPQMTQLGSAMNSVILFAASTKSGYAYLGQLLAHDLSRLRKEGHGLEVKAIENDVLISTVSAVLDLDCIYSGVDASSPHTLTNSACMKFGEVINKHQVLIPGHDLNRDCHGSAVIPDDRNDENLIISQLHLQFLKLHNYFVNAIEKDDPSLSTEKLFEAAKEQVILHFQEVILHDLLYEILHPSVWLAIVHRRQHVLWDPKLDKNGDPIEPAILAREFTGAAARFGHSMVRGNYRLNSKKSVDLADLFEMTGKGSFAGRKRLPASHIVDWLYFFDFPASVTRAAHEGKNISGAISPSVRVRLKYTDGLSRPDIKNLAKRNLLRGNQLGLATGQSVVEYTNRVFHSELKNCGISIVPLTKDQLDLNRDDDEENLLTRHCPELIEKTPLWYYLLAEAYAEHGFEYYKLGPMGSLILAESIVGLLQLDKNSLLHKKNRRDDITPSKVIPEVEGKRFLSMSDLILAVNPGLPDPTELDEITHNN